MERIKEKIKNNLFEWVCITPLFTLKQKVKILKKII